MSLKPSVFDGGRPNASGRCEICGAPLPVNFWGRARYGKCADCAKKIARDVMKDFKDNLGHNLTEAVLVTEKEHKQITQNDRLPAGTSDDD